MFISSSGGQHHTRTEALQGNSKTTPISERAQRRYQYLFQEQPLQTNKTIYQHVVRLVNQFISQLTGKQQEQEQESDPKKPHARQGLGAQDDKLHQIRGIADRSPQLVDPENPRPRRDTVFIGGARDYPAPVIAIEYNGNTHPAFYEGNQIVARHLYLDNDETAIDAKLILNDGSRFPVEILIITAV